MELGAQGGSGEAEVNQNEAPVQMQGEASLTLPTPGEDSDPVGRCWDHSEDNGTYFCKEHD
jgi:hypothetical protein